MAYVKQTWRDLPNQTTPLSAARLNKLETQYDQAVNYTDQAIQNSVTPGGGFELETATLNYGLNARPSPNNRRVMQSVFVSSGLEGEVWYSVGFTPSGSSNESTRVVRCTSAGGFIGEMVLTDAGHGTGVFVEVDDTGAIWVWCATVNFSIASQTPGRHGYARIPWQAGATLTHAQQTAYALPAVTGDGSQYVTAHFDEFNGTVGLRRNVNPATSTYRYETHQLSDLVSGISDPQNAFTFSSPPTGDWFTQGWALLDGQWYILSGTATNAGTYFPARVVKIGEAGVQYVRNVDSARYVAEGVENGGWSEPEGLSAARGPLGEPCLVFGMCTGPTGYRANTVWSLSMGSNPFPGSSLAASTPPDDSGWYTSVVSFNSGFSSSTSLLQRLEARRSGNKVYLRGRIEGSFPAGVATEVGTLSDGLFNPGRTTRFLATGSWSSTSENSAARVDVSTSGVLTIYPDRRNTGETAFIHIPDNTFYWVQ